PFDYVSKIQTETRAAAVRAQVPPVFQRSFKPYDEFREIINDLNSRIAKSQIDFEAKGEDTVKAELEKTTEDLVETSALKFDPELITQLTDQTTPRERSTLFNDALAILKALYEDGIYSTGATEGDPGQVTVIQLV